MRKFFFALFLMLAVTFVLAHLAEVSSIAIILKKADWRYILLAIGILGAWLINTAMVYWSLYQIIGIKDTLPRLALIVASAYFVNVVAPSGGVSGVAIFISDARQKGISQARVTIASAVVILLDYLSFFLVLSLGLVVLIRRSTLSTTELIASLIMATLAGGLGVLLYRGMQSSTALGNSLATICRGINRLLWPFLHREYIAEQRAHEFAHDAAGGLYSIRHQPRSLIQPGLLALNGKLLLVLIFFLIFLAFKVPYSPGTIIAGWSISYLFTIISPTPGGMGVVEGILPLSLASLNVPLGAATVITLVYRGITFWLPLITGMVAFRGLINSNKTPSLA